MLVFVMRGTMSQVAAWLAYLAKKCGSRTIKQILDEGEGDKGGGLPPVQVREGFDPSL